MKLKTANKLAWIACLGMAILWICAGNAAASSVWTVGGILIAAIEANR